MHEKKKRISLRDFEKFQSVGHLIVEEEKGLKRGRVD